MVLVRPDAIRCWLLRAGDSWLSAARGFARYASLSSVVEMGRRVEMGKRRGGTRKACVLVAVMACVLAVVGLGLIATGRLCITSARRPADRYGQDCCSDGGAPRASLLAAPWTLPTSISMAFRTTRIFSPPPSRTSGRDRITRAPITLPDIPMTSSASAPTSSPLHVGMPAMTCNGWWLPTSSTVRTPTASPPRIRRSIFAAPRTSRCSWVPMP